MQINYFLLHKKQNKTLSASENGSIYVIPLLDVCNLVVEMERLWCQRTFYGIKCIPDANGWKWTICDTLNNNTCKGRLVQTLTQTSSMCQMFIWKLSKLISINGVQLKNPIWPNMALEYFIRPFHIVCSRLKRIHSSVVLSLRKHILTSFTKSSLLSTSF